jgi:hypothetical protein
MASRRWDEAELIRVLIEYCDIPFGQLHSRNPKIIQLASELGRSPSSIALKMVNFVSLDPTIDRKGMSNVSALDKEVWNKFFNNIDYYFSEATEDITDRTVVKEGPQEEFRSDATRE